MLRLMSILSGPVHFTIDELAERIESSRRSVFRYLDTLRSAGFVIDRTIQNRYRMLEMSESYKDLRNVVFFSEEEARVLVGLIDGLHQSNGLKRNLHDKLATIFEKTDLRRYVDDRDRAYNIALLREAMDRREQVILRGYSSSNSGIVHDALVEPYDFSGEYVDVFAYDVQNCQNRVFKIARVESVEMIRQPWAFEGRHRKDHTDVFRMTGPSVTPVKIVMNRRARNLLVEEYPMAESCLVERNGTWMLATEVTSMAGVGRFVMGLRRDVRVVDSPELSKYIEDYLFDDSNCPLGQDFRVV